MKQSFLLAPPCRLNQPFDGEAGSGGGGMSEMTRRKFLKRAGGATVATVVALSLSSNQAYAQDEEGRGSSWVMECVGPDQGPQSNPVVLTMNIIVPQPIPYAPVQTTVSATVTSSAVTNPAEILHKPWTGLGEVNVGAGDPSLFSISFAATCDPSNGIIAATADPGTAPLKKKKIGETEVGYKALRGPVILDDQNMSGRAISRRTAVVGVLFCVANNQEYYAMIPLQGEQTSLEFIPVPENFDLNDLNEMINGGDTNFVYLWTQFAAHKK